MSPKKTRAENSTKSPKKTFARKITIKISEPEEEYIPSSESNHKMERNLRIGKLASLDQKGTKIESVKHKKQKTTLVIPTNIITFKTNLP